MGMMFDVVCSFDNLKLAFNRARKGKTQKQYVLDFEAQLHDNLLQLQTELFLHSYRPKPLKTFILRDPKTRKISKSDFRDRIIHHALCIIIEPLFDKQFIYDSYANRIGKGTLKAVERFDVFKRKVSKNNTKTCFVLKADIKHYFDTVDHDILLAVIARKIYDKQLLWLIRTILENHHTLEKSKGMPLGNLTSQFFANVYLNELDQFVKHALKAKYYVRYVDDFVIFDTQKETLEFHKQSIEAFLKEELCLDIHPAKSKITTINSGISFLGFQHFFHHKLVRKKNRFKFEKKLKRYKKLYSRGKIELEKIIESFEGWLSYVSHANTYKYRRKVTKLLNNTFPATVSIQKPVSKKIKNFQRKVQEGTQQFSIHKTLQLFKKGRSLQQIAMLRNIKEGTVWEHLAKLIEWRQISIWAVLPRKIVINVLVCITDEKESLKDIRTRLNDSAISFNEIACVLAYFNVRKKKIGVKRWKELHIYTALKIQR